MIQSNKPKDKNMNRYKDQKTSFITSLLSRDHAYTKHSTQKQKRWEIFTGKGGHSSKDPSQPQRVSFRVPLKSGQAWVSPMSIHYSSHIFRWISGSSSESQLRRFRRLGLSDVPISGEETMTLRRRPFDSVMMDWLLSAIRVNWKKKKIDIYYI